MTNQSFIRNMNERRILTLLRREGSLSRAEIARRLSLTRSAVTYLADGLMATKPRRRGSGHRNGPAGARCRQARRGAVAQPDRQLFPGRRDRRARDALRACRHDDAAGEDADRRSREAAAPGGRDPVHQEFSRRMRGGQSLPGTRARRRRHRARPGAQRRLRASFADPGMARRQLPRPGATVLPASRSASKTTPMPRPSARCTATRNCRDDLILLPEARQWLRRRRHHQRPAAAWDQRGRHRVRAHARRRGWPAMPLRTDRLPGDACQSDGAGALPCRGRRRDARRSGAGGTGRAGRACARDGRRPQARRLSGDRHGEPRQHFQSERHRARRNDAAGARARSRQVAASRGRAASYRG